MSGGRGGGGCWWNQLSTFDAEFKFAKIQNSYVWWRGGEGVGGTNFQLLMLSSNLLKSKNSYVQGGGGGGGSGVGGTNFQFLMLSSNLLKSKILMSGSGWGGGGELVNQLSTFDAEFKLAKIQNSHVWLGGGGGVGGTNFQLLMLSPNLLKKKILKKIFLSFWAKM